MWPFSRRRKQNEKSNEIPIDSDSSTRSDDVFTPKRAIYQSDDFKNFSDEYHTQEREILILTSEGFGGGAKIGNSWQPSADFLAYVDLKNNELRMGDGRCPDEVISGKLIEESPSCFGYSRPL